MGVLIVAGTVTLVVLLVQRAGGARVASEARVEAGVAPQARGEAGVAPQARGEVGVAPQEWAAPVVLGQPDGSRIGGVVNAGGALAVWVVRPDGDRVVLLDPASGRRVGEVRLRE
jgi:hypothetical protein